MVDEITRPLAFLTQHLVRSEEAATALQKRLNTIKDLFKGGSLLVGAGAAVAAPLLYAVDKAAELQKQLIGVQIATRGTAQQMNDMRLAIEKIAGVTVFSNIDVAKMAKTIATGTGLGAQQVQSLLPAYAKFADVQLLMKGTPYAQSIPDAIRLAHTAQHYDAASLGTYLDLLTKASFLVPGGLGEVGHALKYSQGIAKTALGVDDKDMVLMTALMNRLGLAGSRGGTNLIAAMTRTIPGIFGSGLLKGKSNEALRAMGMIDAKGHSKAFADGKFDMFSWMGLMGEYVQREFASHPEAIARQDIAKNFQHAFGVQGGRVAALLSSPQAIEQFRQIGDTFGQYGGVESMQRTFANQSVAQQYMNAKTNLVSAWTELGVTLLPLASRALTKFNGYMQTLITWMTKNPDSVGKFAKDVALFAGTLATLGIISITTSAIAGLATALGVLRTAVIATTAAAGGGSIAGGISRFGKFGVAAGIGLAAYEGTRWIADTFTPKDFSFGGWLYDKTHSQPAHKGQTTVNLHIDGKKVAEAVVPHMSMSLTGPETSANIFDSRMQLTPPGF